MGWLAGWDDNYSRENFNEGCRPKNNGAWLIRNSWGTDWGDDGYFWLSYEDKTIDYGCFYNMEEKDNYARNYQYDTIGWCYSLGLADEDGNPSADNSAYMSNIFTAEETEQLEAVSFYTTDAGTSYEISVYTDLADPDDPTSGTKSSVNQSGQEPYAGYHTIELDEPVLLTEGKKFSVVVKLTNPEYPSPIPAELCLMPIEKKEPEYMGNGGESFVSLDGSDWADAAGLLEVDEEYGNSTYITNVCVKAFTNPVSTVNFSVMEGPVALGMPLTLTAPGADEIYYTTDGRDPITSGTLYTVPITIDQGMTIKAVAKKGTTFGAVREKTYTQASAQLTDLAIISAADKAYTLHLDPNEFKSEDYTGDSDDICVPEYVTSIKVMAQSGDQITVNGTALNSSELTEEIPLATGENTTITVKATGDGKTDSKYTIRVYRSIMKFDYRAETVSFDGEKYILKDENQNEIHSGDNITHLISETVEHSVRVTTKDGVYYKTEYIPTRQTAAISPIDFANEATMMMYGAWNEVATKPDMSDAVKWNGTTIPLTPGQNVYIRKYATDTAFASKIKTMEVPPRPAAPEVSVEEITETSVTLTAVKGAIYSEEGRETCQDSPVFSDLAPGTKYTFSAWFQPTDNAFRSELKVIPVTTKTPEVNPEDYSFTVTYVDLDGEAILGGTITFEKTGPYSRENIPIPYGYIQVIPTHPGEEWLYPTALQFIDGEWKVTNPSVKIMVEKMAVVNIIFKTPDGHILEDICGTNTFDEVGITVETVTAPDGYEFVGKNTYEVTVTRDEGGHLIATPSEVVFVVKAVGSGEPSENPPKIIKGANQTVKWGENAVFESDADLKDFLKVLVDGKEITTDNYMLKAGSTIVILKADYLKTLSAGTHTIAIISTNGVVETNFTVEKSAKPTNPNQDKPTQSGIPQTGDITNIMLWMALLLVSSSIVFTTIRKKKS